MGYSANESHFKKEKNENCCMVLKFLHGDFHISFHAIIAREDDSYNGQTIHSWTVLFSKVKQYRFFNIFRRITRTMYTQEEPSADKGMGKLTSLSTARKAEFSLTMRSACRSTLAATLLGLLYF